MPDIQQVTQRVATEWSFTAERAHTDPWNGPDVDVLFTHEAGQTWRVPAFWAGRGEWRVRFAPPLTGRYSFRTECTDAADGGLHGRTGELTAGPYTGDNPLLRHGPLCVSPDQRHLQHEDGTPFFWLGDTWWYAMHRRLTWPNDFQALTEDRRQKGFTVAQVVMGLHPELEVTDPRCAGDGGMPWEKDFARANPEFFNAADIRVQWLVEQGTVPCLFGSWGYHLSLLGPQQMKRHWRNLVARYGAYPVVWCLAGEAAMPYYRTPGAERESQTLQLKKGWSEMGRYVRGIDPFHRLLTIHPRRSSREDLEDASVVDFIMLQTGHDGWNSAATTAAAVRAEYAGQPAKPVLNGEVTYEMHIAGNWPDAVRFMFWTCLLGGACGHTYGAGGIWQANTRREPCGASLHHPPYENTPWDEAAAFAGAAHLALAKRFLMRFPWSRLEPHDEWVEPRWTKEDIKLCCAAGIPRELRIIYRPCRLYRWGGPLVRAIEPDVKYRAWYFDPIAERRHDIGPVIPDASGSWQAPEVPLAQDWVLVLERQQA